MKLLYAAWLTIMLGNTSLANAQIAALNGRQIPVKTMDSFILDKMQTLDIPGLSIAFVNNGQIVYSVAFGYSSLLEKIKVDTQTIFEAASLSKSVFALFVMQLVKRNIIALDTPLYQYLPYPDIAYDDRYKRITTRMVLCHTSGFPNWRQDAPDTSLRIVKNNLYLKFIPGTEFSYSGEGYVYLARAVEHLLHTNKFEIGERISKDVFKPLGMQHSIFGWNNFVEQHKATGYVHDGERNNSSGRIKKFIEFDPAGGLHTNAVDFARWLISMMDLQRANTPPFNDMFNEQSQPEPNSERDAWGLGVMIKHTPYGIRYSHSGNNGDFQAYYVMFPENQKGFVFFINNNRASALYNSLITLLETGEVEKEKESIAIAPEIIQQYIGDYQAQSGKVMKIMLTDGKLYLQQSNTPQRFELHSDLLDHFFFKTDPAVLQFIRNAKGDVSSFELQTNGTTLLFIKIK